MKRIIVITIIILVGFFQFSLKAQDKQVYKHPFLNFQFEAPTGWKQIKHKEDRMIYEITDSEKKIHVMLWYSATMQNTKGYLEKMADMKGLHWEGEPVVVKNWEEEAFKINASGNVWGMDSKVLLIVIPHGFDIKHTDHFAHHIVMIWCPEMEYSKYKFQMEDILKSVKFLG